MLKTVLRFIRQYDAASTFWSPQSPDCLPGQSLVLPVHPPLSEGEFHMRNKITSKVNQRGFVLVEALLIMAVAGILKPIIGQFV